MMHSTTRMTTTPVSNLTFAKQLLAVAAIVDGASQPGTHDVGRPNVFSPISSAPFTVGVIASSLGSALDLVKGSCKIFAPLDVYIYHSTDKI